MTDIVERLREITPDVTGKSYFWGKQVKEAADEIERLRLELSATHDMAATLEADVLRLRAERDALRADAERWRYLRARRWIEIAAGSVDFSIAGPDASAEAQAFRDSEIDAALAARGKE